jgi:hypothetical protein
LFNGLLFVPCFATILFAAVLLRRHAAFASAMLLVASYAYYACWDRRVLALIIGATATGQRPQRPLLA